MHQNQEIQALKMAFTKHRQTNNKAAFPTELWQRAVALTKDQPLVDVAKQIGVSATRLRYKVKQFQTNPAIHLIEASGLLAGFEKQIHLEFTFPNNMKCHVTTCGSLQELISCMKGFV